MLYSKILNCISEGKRQLVVLIDPESVEQLPLLIDESLKADVDMFFVGGSTFQSSANDIVHLLKKKTHKPVVLFPGNLAQITKGVDAVLFLSLLSGRNAEFLIGNHVKAAPLLVNTEVIPVAYLLIDGGSVSATQRVTNTDPLPVDDVDKIVNTALAGQLLGHKLVYLEAGSGAMNPVLPHIISAVKSVINIPLIVGGGIKTKQDLDMAYNSGADIVVVGNALETNPELLSTFGETLASGVLKS